MKSHLILIGLLLFGVEVYPNIIKKSTTLHFKTDEHVLHREDVLNLKNFLDELELTGDYEVILFGHTDSRGSFSYNDELSNRRATEVEGYLLDFGVLKEALVRRSHGEWKPMASNSDAHGMSLNRRVEVFFKKYEYKYLKDIEEGLIDGLLNQEVIDPQTDNIILCKRGVELNIPANSLIDANGNRLHEKVSLEVTEALDFIDFAGNQLSTVSNGKLLVSGGMIELRAFDLHGRPIELMDAASIGVKIPSENQNLNFELFNTSDDGQTWAPMSSNTVVTAVEVDLIPVMGFRMMPRKPRYPRGKRLAVVELGVERPGPSPRIPKEPKQPRKPRKLDSETYFAEMTFMQRTFAKKKTYNRQNTLYEEAIGAFEKREERYERALSHYEKQMKDHLLQMKEYTELYQEWKVKKDKAQEWTDEKCKVASYIKTVDPSSEQIAEYNKLMLKYQSELPAWYKDRLEFEKKQIERAQKAETTSDNGGAISYDDLNNYAFRINKLGWINCDRFYDVPKELMSSITIWNPSPDSTRILLVYNQLRSSVNLSQNYDYKISYPNYPKTEPATIVAYKLVNGKVHLAVQEVEDDLEMSLNFKEATLSDLRRTLSALNEGRKS